MKEANINDELMDAVTFCKLQVVEECLENGADPNYTIKIEEREDDDIFQPTTPLKLVMFRISDSLLEDKDLKQFTKISKLLLRYGADPEPAMQIAEARYGKYDSCKAEKGSFMDVWHILANAKHY